MNASSIGVSTAATVTPRERFVPQFGHQPAAARPSLLITSKSTTLFPWLRKRFFSTVAKLTMGLYAASATTLLASTILPNKPSLAEKTTASTLSNQSWQNTLAELKDQMRRLGYSGIAIGIMGSSVTDLGVGIRKKQPFLIGANIAFITAAPFFNTGAVWSKGLFLILDGLDLLGYSRVLTPNAKRQADPFLLNTLQHAPQELRRTIHDTVTLLKSIPSGQHFSIQPSESRLRLCALGHLAGGTMVMTLGQLHPVLAILGTSTAALAGVGASLNWYALGSQRQDNLGKALRWGTLLEVIGKAALITDAGYAAEHLGYLPRLGISEELTAPAAAETKPSSPGQRE